ncbi:hypothetical protein BCM40_08005 [Planococcus donghaensis]|uniref:Uncharacterized protein n=2 Tax=Planococcus donghaensis TaxID=414778 RepID=A0A1C7EIX2_9BACL|nr:hypothetical protein BCM40_08005 [Planococcus donghaensis]
MSSTNSKTQQLLAFVPLVLVAVMNSYLVRAIPGWYPNGFDFAALALVNGAVTTSALGDQFNKAIAAANIPPELFGIV